MEQYFGAVTYNWMMTESSETGEEAVLKWQAPFQFTFLKSGSLTQAGHNDDCEIVIKEAFLALCRTE